MIARIHPKNPQAGSEYYRERRHADNTRRAYAGAVKRWESWARGRFLSPRPAAPEDVAEYLAHLADTGSAVSTVRLAKAAIAHAHTTDGLEDPTTDERVAQTMAGIATTLGVAPHQAKPLTEEDAQAIVEAAGSVQWRKWRLDAALVTVMRDGLLRRSEAASLTWRDIVPAVDGSGRVAIRRSKGDQVGQGALVYIRPATTKLLTAWKNDEERRTKRDLVFGLSDPGSICRRIKRAAKAAGLAGAYSGHSPRIGMAVDLAAAGVELPALMATGRWKSPMMPAHYTRSLTAASGAVAKVFGGEGE